MSEWKGISRRNKSGTYFSKYRFAIIIQRLTAPLTRGKRNLFINILSLYRSIMTLNFLLVWLQSVFRMVHGNKKSLDFILIWDSFYHHMNAHKMSREKGQSLDCEWEIGVNSYLPADFSLRILISASLHMLQLIHEENLFAIWYTC